MPALEQHRDARMYGTVQLPAELKVNIDPMARVARILYRGRLDVAPSIVDLPFSFFKQIGAVIAQNEVQQEAHGILTLHGQRAEIGG